jgi:hypothetical protein
LFLFLAIFPQEKFREDVYATMALTETILSNCMRALRDKPYWFDVAFT